MARSRIARSPSARPTPRRKGFVTFCAVVSVFIVALIVDPFSAAAGRGAATADQQTVGDTHDGERQSASARHTPEPTRPGDPDTLATIPATTLGRLIDAGRPIRCGGGTEPLVALTFDDGPGVLTPRALDLLEERGMTATFFLAGKLLGEPRFAGLPRAEARIGALGDHTWDHVSTVGLSAAELDHQIGDTRRAIEAAGRTDVVLFRPPLGQHDETVDAYVRSQGMVTVLWSIDTGDSMGARPDEIVAAVDKYLSPGDIVLLHDNRATTEDALPRILDLIEARGYTTVTVPQLLAQDPPTNAQLRQGTCPA